MRFNLQFTYWCLVTITIISSCFLFLFVASESIARNSGTVADDVAENNANVQDSIRVRAESSGVKANSIHNHKFIKVKKDNNPSRIEAEFVQSLPNVNIKVSSTTSGEKSEAPLPAEFNSVEENLLASDGIVLSDENSVPISEGNILQLEIPQLSVLNEKESTSRSKRSISEDVSVNSIVIETPADVPSLPDISSESPTVIPLNEITSTDLPLGSGLEQHTIDPVLISKPESNATNQTKDLNEAEITENVQKANDQIVKINDSGGSIPPQPPDDDDLSDTGSQIQLPMATNATTNETIIHEVNLTAEEVPIPVFSEWAQKQMEAEEKQQLEQDVVNSSSQKKNLTTGSKLQSGKLRTKNYASPDCGAKIIASNSDAQNTGAVLTSSKDEYMLSPCTNRIWFVVELCEAIQAEKIDLANFELFSSSPKNFTVAVSNRFPTRDWSNVGRFIADDKRTIQTFELHPHLFGKFVRVDIHSHYNSEHFCPVSLFRVYGTSEFEAFETEDRAVDDIDEYDDDLTSDQMHQKMDNSNLFKSASDAVLSIVKKAAEVLVKTNTNRTAMESKTEQGCFTPSTGDFICTQCKDASIANKVNYILSCKHSELVKLLEIERLRSDIFTSEICAKRFNVNLSNRLDCKTSGQSEKNSYFLTLLPEDYIGALCKILAGGKRMYQNNSIDVESDGEQNGEVSLNLTIDKTNGGAFGDFEKIPELTEGNKRKPKVKDDPIKEQIPATVPPSLNKDESIITSSEPIDKETLTTNSDTLDVNIYNIQDDDTEREATLEAPPVDIDLTGEKKLDEVEILPPTKVDTETIPKSQVAGGNSAENDPSTWENLDTLLAESVVAGTVATIGGNNQGNQQRIATGPHSESVFIRLNNRIKALERNMSLSGQYLEELSRRYKKQVEELQLSLTKTVRALEEQNRRYSEQERVLLDRNALLKEELDDVSLQVYACIILIIFVGSFMILLTVVGVVLYRSMRRNLSPSNKHIDKRKTTQKKLNRRKSFDDFSDASMGRPKMRRPSEEAMLILKDCTGGTSAPESDVPSTKLRQRKISVFYGKKANRKGEKRSWPELTKPGEFNPGVEDLPTSEPLSEPVLEDEEYDQFNASESDSLCTSDQQPSSGKSASRRFSNLFNGKNSKKIKKTSPKYKRQESAPGVICNVNTVEKFDEKLILDEDEIENFIPGSDLAYNEFMPDGPSGYQISDSAKQSDEAKKNGKKPRRLSSPAFFKSPFSKISKKSTPPHESTSWEWYRSKKSSLTSSSQHQQNGAKSNIKVNGISNSAGHNNNMQPSPASSLSEILPNSGQGSSDNSFRMLEEAINTSNIATSSSSNGNSGCGSHSGSSAGSARSSKKNRSFNRIFKKVF